ncbi:ParM/StbA family protein [Acinetobacter indicus]|uniref:ParM/StbA family protein n=1 Tax=Acinetobacter TaxID=469 RepID=UPI0015D21F54|nr:MULTISPECIES: ParM/StbA family protein [Acinetobacter]MCP0918073.1 ParM/StbA family protein [Acinetobacter indicus]
MTTKQAKPKAEVVDGVIYLIDENGNRQKYVLLLGIDDGHSHIKIYGGLHPLTNEPILFKIPSKASVGLTLTSDNQDKVDSQVVTVNNNHYTVSDIVSNPIDTRTADYPLSDFNKALIHQCLSLAERNGILPIVEDHEIYATTGLPVDLFYSGPQRNNQLIEDKVEFLKNGDLVFNHLDKRESKNPFKFIEHAVFCEAQAAYFDACMTDDGNLTEIGADLLEFGAGILDIGGRTTDCLVSAPGGQTFFRERTTTLKLGVLTLFDNIRDRIKVKLGNNSTINAKFLDKAIRTGSYGLTGNSIDVSDIIAEEKLAMAVNIKNFSDKHIGDGSDLAGVICVGGGAIFLKEELQKCMPNLIFVDHSEYANARGFYKMARHIYALQDKAINP